MKKNAFFWIIFILALGLAATQPGCSSNQGYDTRLTKADSLLKHHPDSALAVLSTLDGGSFIKTADRAYHALLLTQARYRCYIAARSDSLIDIAVDYYKKHPDEQEKLTRAYIYKGAVLEELGKAEQAMSYYKLSESTVAAADYFNRGYINLRLGNLYRDHHIADSSDILRFKGALRYFRQIPDSFYIMTCLTEVGNSYMKHNSDSVLPYLEQALEISASLGDNDYQSIIELLIAKHLMFSDNIEDIARARRSVLSLIARGDTINDIQDTYMTAAFVMAKSNRPDSARILLDSAQPYLASGEDTVFFDRCMAEIARASGDINEYQRYYETSERKAHSIAFSNLQRQLRDVEAKYDNEAIKYEALRYKSNWIMSLLGTGVAIGILSIIALTYRRKLSQRKRQLQESEDTIERLHADTAILAAQLADNQSMNNELKDTIRHQIDTFGRLVEMHSSHFAHNPKKFSAIFKTVYSVSQPDDSFWDGIQNYADSTCGGIISHTVAEFPSLSQNDVRFLSLCCCELPTTVIMACMGYNEVHSVYNKKRRMAEALGLDGKLDDYIARFQSGVRS